MLNRISSSSRINEHGSAIAAAFVRRSICPSPNLCGFYFFCSEGSKGDVVEGAGSDSSDAISPAVLEAGECSQDVSEEASSPIASALESNVSNVGGDDVVYQTVSRSGGDHEKTVMVQTELLADETLSSTAQAEDSKIVRSKTKKMAEFKDSSNTNSHNVSEISELIAMQHWQEMRTLLEKSDPHQLLQKLLDSQVDIYLIVQYFRWLRRDHGVSHSLELYCRMLHLLADTKSYQLVRRLLNEFVENETHSVSSIFHMFSLLVGPRHSWPVVDMLVLAYVQNLKVDLAREAFQRARDYGFRLSTTSCNPLLSALVEEERIEVVERIYREMINRRIHPNAITFNIVINGFCKVGMLQKASDLMVDMKVWGVIPTVVTYNTIIGGYCNKGRVGKLYKANAFITEMLSMKICPNEITYNTLIDGFCKDGNFSGAVRVFKEMQSLGLKPGVVTYNALVNRLCGDGKIDEALSLRDEMLTSGLKPDIVTYNTLISGCSKRKMVKEAKKLLGSAIKSGLSPNVTTFNTLIDAHCKVGLVDEAVSLCGLMLRRNISPDTSTCNCLLTGFYENNKIEEARRLLTGMEDLGVKADVVTFNIRARALCQKGESRKAVRVLDEMHRLGVTPNYVTYNTLIDGYCREGNLRAAMTIRMRMEKEGRKSNVVTYNILIKYLCDKDELEEANKLLGEMLEKGLVPNRNTYEIIKEGMMEKGFVPDIEGHVYNQSVPS